MQQPDCCSNSKSLKLFRDISRRWSHRCLRGKAKWKTYVLRRLVKVANEVGEQTDSGRLFQGELKALAPVLVLILGTGSDSSV